MATLRREPDPPFDLRGYLLSRFRERARHYERALGDGFAGRYSGDVRRLERGEEIVVYAFQIPREHRQPFGPNDRIVVAADGSLSRETRHDRSTHV